MPKPDTATVQAFQAGRFIHLTRDAHLDGDRSCCDRAGLAGAIPLIEAQAVREAAGAYEKAYREALSVGPAEDLPVHVAAGIEWLSIHANRIEQGTANA